MALLTTDSCQWGGTLALGRPTSGTEVTRAWLLSAPVKSQPSRSSHRPVKWQHVLPATVLFSSLMCLPFTHPRGCGEYGQKGSGQYDMCRNTNQTKRKWGTRKGKGSPAAEGPKIKQRDRLTYSELAHTDMDTQTPSQATRQKTNIRVASSPGSTLPLAPPATRGQFGARSWERRLQSEFLQIGEVGVGVECLGKAALKGETEGTQRVEKWAPQSFHWFS